MSKISILPEFLINKIAAGEVIERPASVVRELIDNSIDAGATQINVEALYGGKKLIKVSDNGAGMNRDDALLCFERHATSKIKSENDLFNISTLGFRGEALPAIASVSKVILTTSTTNADTGTKVEIGVSPKKKITDAPPLQGTTVEISDIFYNTPARRKFLKSITTELSHIIETVIQKAFAYPEISFSLTHNQSDILNVPIATSLKERFIQLYSEELVSEFLDINPSSIISLPQGEGAREKDIFSSQEKGIGLYGFSSKANFTRANRSHQFIFINKRPVKNPTVNHAIYSAYSNLIPKDKHPAYFIFLDINPKKIDINVHPAKREVRFEAPDEIHRLVESAIYEALNLQQDKGISYNTSAEFKTMATHGYTLHDSPVVHESGLDSFKLQSNFPSKDSQTDFFSSGITSAIPTYFHIGESFIATVTDNGLIIIDQHAAHERILYEKFLKKTFIKAEALFLPIRIELPVKEYNIVIKHKDFLHDLGIDIDEFGSNNVIVRTIPKELQKTDIKNLLMDVASGFIEEETNGFKGESGEENLLRNIAARLACHESVRGRERLNNEELSKMMSDLNKTEEPNKCPHGRPTRIFFSMDDLRKMFKRR